MSEYDQRKQIHRYREQTSGFQRGEGRAEGLRGTNYCV